MYPVYQYPGKCLDDVRMACWCNLGVKNSQPTISPTKIPTENLQFGGKVPEKRTSGKKIYECCLHKLTYVFYLSPKYGAN